MKRILSLILVTFGVTTMLLACSTQSKTETTKIETQANTSTKTTTTTSVPQSNPKEDIKKEVTENAKDVSIDDLIEYFKKSNLTVGERTYKAFQMVNATDGCGLKIEKSYIEIYKYDVTNAVGKAMLDEAKKNGKIALWGDYKFFVNGTLTIVFPSDPADTDEKVLKTFLEFK